jgi:hypothetical protein
MGKRFRLTLEQVSGPEDNEEIEIKASWILSKKHWSPTRDLLNSLKLELAKARK